MSTQPIQKIDEFRKRYPNLTGYLHWVLGDVGTLNVDDIAQSFKIEYGPEVTNAVLNEYDHLDLSNETIEIISYLSNIRPDRESIDNALYALTGG